MNSNDAEKAAVWYARVVLGCVVTRRAIRTRWQKVDFFACDVVGKLMEYITRYFKEK